MSKAILFLLALLTLPLAFAFNCDLTQYPQYCKNITDLNISEAEKDLLFSSLLYSYSKFPNHNFVKDYNLGIKVSKAPFNISIKNSNQIKNTWLSFLAIMPSVIENNSLYVPNRFTALSESDYFIYVPENYQANYPETKEGDCRTDYSLIRDEAKLTIYSDDKKISEGKLSNVKISQDTRITAELKINSQIKTDHYHWYSWCCKSNENGCVKTCHGCKFSHSNTESDSLTLEDFKDVKIYSQKPEISIKATDSYNGMTKGLIKASNYSSFFFGSENFTFLKQKYSYDLTFSHKPYYIATLRASHTNYNKQKNINIANNTFVVKGSPECYLLAFNHFFSLSQDCNLSFIEHNSTKLKGNKKNISLDLLLYLLIAGLVIYFFYRLIRSQTKKFTLILLLLFLVPFAVADEEEEKSCGITNLASCIPEKLYEFFIHIVNMPLQPLLIFIKNLLTADVHINIFKHVWKVICYILSFFYLFLFLYSGFVFLTSSDNPIKRAYAKDSIRNIVLMVVLIQGSFFIYNLIIALSSVLNNSILGLIDEHFFMITFDNIFNIGLEFVLFPIYLITLVLSMLMLALRYILVSFGVILFPIGIFCYYAPSLRCYGRFILRILGNFIFITFIDLLVILACSMIIADPIFESFKIVVMIICFSIVNYTLFWCVKFSMSKTDMSGIKDDISQAVKYIALAA